MSNINLEEKKRYDFIVRRANITSLRNTVCLVVTLAFMGSCYLKYLFFPTLLIALESGGKPLFLLYLFVGLVIPYILCSRIMTRIFKRDCECYINATRQMHRIYEK